MYELHYKWFRSVFGVEDSFRTISSAVRIKHTGHDTSLHVAKRGVDARSWRVGAFESLTLADLHHRLGLSSPPPVPRGGDGLTFQTARVGTDFGELIADPANANAVFQMSSHANAAGWDFSPGFEQGLHCARACAAATLHRTHFLDSSVNLCPSPSPNLVDTTQVGVQWSTDVTSGSHSVTLVLCTHIPLALNGHVNNLDLVPAAKTVLYVGYKGTLAAAALLASDNETKTETETPPRLFRVSVYLTILGGPKTPLEWAMDAMVRAMEEMRDYPLDVILVP
jgi:hypothetical protein